jgi:DNA-binding transcriptional LysR family regulator
VDTDQLLAFERIVREGSFGRAAWELGIAQSTISARMRALERVLGGPLFERGRRPLALTPRGREFLPYARRALDVLREGRDAAGRAQEEGQLGRLRLGVLESLSGRPLALALETYRQRFPQVECEIHAGDHVRVVEELADGLIEMGLVVWPDPEPSIVPLKSIHTFDDAVVLAVSRTHPLARGGTVAHAELLHQGGAFLVPNWWPTVPQPVRRLAAEAWPVVRLPIQTALVLALRDQGVGLFTRSWIAREVGQGMLKEVRVEGLPALKRTSALVRVDRAGGLSIAAQHFAACLPQHFERY